MIFVYSSKEVGRLLKVSTSNKEKKKVIAVLLHNDSIQFLPKQFVTFSCSLNICHSWLQPTQPIYKYRPAIII